MNRLEANLSLLIITFFAAIQYVFLAWVPESVSHFAFLCVTNLVGFLMTLAFFFGELFRLDGKQVQQSAVLSAELIVFNLFLLLGVSKVGPTTTAAVLSAYFVFIVVLSIPLFGQWPDRTKLLGSAMILLGLFLLMDVDMMDLWDKDILYLVIADLAFAIYIITAGRYAGSSNPSILAMGQTFFCFLFSLVLWIGEWALYGVPLSLPSGREIWASILYISFFIRGLYGVVQVYAQRYVTPLNTSLIFSTEILMTLTLSPLLTLLFGAAPEQITLLKGLGGVLMVAGLLVIDPLFLDTLRRGRRGGSSAQAVRGTRHHYGLYGLLCGALLGGCALLLTDGKTALIYGALGFLAGIPVSILLEGVLYLGLLPQPDDVAFDVRSGAESLGEANEALEEAASEQGVGLKRLFELQSCLEELFIRIFDALPEAQIHVRARFGEAISVILSWPGERHNPLYIGKDEDEVNVAGLKIIKHRALQASFSRRGQENRLHIVV